MLSLPCKPRACDMGLVARVQALLNRLLPRASFVRNVGVLAGGTAAAQAIGVLVLPVITRLYTPADFSILAVYASILGIVAGVACLRLEIAIPLPELDEDAANLLAVALLCSTAFSLLATLFVWWVPDHIVNAVSQPGLRPFLWMIPLGIWLASSYAALQYWATRKKRFGAIAKTRIGQTAGSTVTQLAGGILNAVGPFGLLLAQLIGSGAGVFGMARTAWREDKQALLGINWADIRHVLRAHDRFPRYSTFEAFANNGAIQLPIIIIAAVTAGPEAGYLFLAMRAMAIPIGLIGGAVSQVYLSRAPDENRAGQLGPFTLKAIAGLMRTGVGPLLFVGIVSPMAFPLVFGADWERAGEMVAWMTPWFILQFVSSPVSMSMHVTNNQRTALQLQIFGFILRVGGTWLATLCAAEYVFEVYAVTGLIFYAVYLLVVAHITGINTQDLLLTLFTKPQMCIAWVVFGVGVIGLMPYILQLIRSL